MSESMSIIITTMIFCLTVSIVYFSKEKINSKETKIYTYLLVLSIINLITELALCFNILLNFDINSFYNIILNRFFLITLFSWYTLFTYYSVGVCYYSKDELFGSIKAKKNYSIIKIISTMFLIISLFLILFLPIDMVSEKSVAYTTGAAPNYILLLCIFYSIMIILSIMINKRNISYKKIYPFIALSGIFILMIFGRIFMPGILLNSFSVAFPTILMFFTIENPDLKMIEALSDAHLISEQTNDEKTKFLFDVTKDIENSLNKAEAVYNNIIELNPSPLIKEEINNLKKIIDVSRIRTKQTIDVSEIDSKKLRTINTKYNIKLLIDSLYLQLKKEVKPNVDFRLNISNGLPDELYGDSMKLKQILTTIINNSIKYTTNGFIELRINYIFKYNICRLIITVEDSGSGMNILKQNEILSNHEDLTEEEINNVDESNLNLKVIRKMINLIGGTLTIDSVNDKGTSVKVILDQKVVVAEMSKDEQNIEKYADSLKNKKRVAIISLNNYKLIKKVVKSFDCLFEEYNVTLDCLTNIRNNVKYDLIIIDQNMDKIDAVSFLYKAKRVDGFNGKVIVISDAKDFKMKKELLDNGFDSILADPFSKEEVTNKIKNI